MSRKWTDEERRKQSGLMKTKKIWEKSTGPKSEEGRQRASCNAWKHGNRSANSQDMRRVLKQHNEFIRDLEKLLKLG